MFEVSVIVYQLRFADVFDVLHGQMIQSKVRM